MPSQTVVEAPAPSGNPLEQAEKIRQDGNELLSKGNMADASKKYQEGLLAIVACTDASKANPLRVALHLNCSLAELRRGNLGSAVEHASGALSADPDSSKAYYRRGFARMRLAEHPGHDSEKDLAIKDFERAIELDSNNAEAKQHLRTLKELKKSQKKEDKELTKSQKEQFKGIFSSGKALYDDAAPAEPGPVERDPGGEDHPVVVSADSVSFSYDRGTEILKEVSLDLRAGWCVGMFGNNAEGKTTLARLLCSLKKPSSGGIFHFVEEADGNTTKTSAKAAWSFSNLSWVVGFGGMPLVAVLVAVAASVGPAGLQKAQVAILKARKPLMMLLKHVVWWHLVVVFGVVLAIALAVILLIRKFAASRGDRSGNTAASQRKLRVLHVPSEISDKEEIDPKKTIEKVIGEKLAAHMSKEERREKVIALLKAGGFQMYNQETQEPTGDAEEYLRDALKFGTLSGGQQHLIYLLRCFASRPDVIIGDELLGGLDAVRQPRVLHMLNRLKREAGTAVLYISCELHPQILVTDSLCFLKGGRVVEHGVTEDVLDFPKHPATKEYVGQYRSLPGCSKIGGKLAEAFAGVKDDAALKGPWIPPKHL